MVLVTLEMNGQKEIMECPDRGTAGDFACAWVAARRKSYPRGLAIIKYYPVSGDAEVVEDRGG